MLITLSILRFRSKNVKKIGLWVNWVDSPQVAKQMYENLGFVKVEVYKDPNSSFVSEYMEKEL